MYSHIMQLRDSRQAIGHHCWHLCCSGDTTVLIFYAIQTNINIHAQEEVGLEHQVGAQVLPACDTSEPPHPTASVASHVTKRVRTFLHTRPLAASSLFTLNSVKNSECRGTYAQFGNASTFIMLLIYTEMILCTK